MLVDFAKGLELYLEGESSLLSCSLCLAETPCSQLYKTAISPDRATGRCSRLRARTASNEAAPRQGWAQRKKDGPEKRVRGDADAGSELSGLLSAFELRFLNAGFRSKASAAH
ncbi:MAG TPA: hypothetical protein VK524_19160 [Polyangiaceae bacterium]|nr:hypothetical protein [Polyangiaceae bacterium]